MPVTEVPIPRAMAARPRDQRGTRCSRSLLGRAGRPDFAATGTARTYVCAVERRCLVRGLTMAPGPVWRVVSGPGADAIDAAQSAMLKFVNRQATLEAPGHRLRMLYAAVVCPYPPGPPSVARWASTPPLVDAR